MGTTDQTLSLLSVARSYLAGQLTRHPRRYIEILRIVQKYHLYAIFSQIGLQNQSERQHSRTGALNVERQASNLAQALEELGTCFIKLGQVLSTRPDLLPPPYISALSRLQHSIHPIEHDKIAAIIEEDLGSPPSTLFRSIDCEPLATASMAQVHRAVMHNGKNVAVKVQRPGVQQQVEIDIDVMQEVARFSLKHMPSNIGSSFIQIVQEVKQSLNEELNFRQEADNTLLIRQEICEFPHLLVPTVFPAYTSQRVLTLSFVQGRHLAQVSPHELQQIDTAVIAEELLCAFLKQMVVNGIFHCDPHPGNILLTDNGHLAILDFGMVGRFDTEQIDKILLLLIAFSERQGERVAQTYLEMIDLPEQFDRRAFTQEICALVSRYYDMSKSRHIEIGRALLDLASVAQSYHTSLPANFTLMGKALLNLDGTLRALSPEMNLIQVIQRYMARVVQSQALSQMSSGRSYAWFLEAKHLAENMLHRTDIITDKLAHDQLTIHLKIDRLDETIQKAAQQLSFGMVVSSLFVSTGLFFMSRRKRYG